MDQEFILLAPGVSKKNPVFTGSISLGRVENSTVGHNSVAEGEKTVASATGSHAEGKGTIANVDYLHTAGTYNKEINVTIDHSEYTLYDNTITYVKGDKVYNVSPGRYPNPSYYQYFIALRTSVGVNPDTSFNKDYWRYVGKSNDEMHPDTAICEVIGNGTSDDYRSNARVLDIDGNEYLNGDLYINCDEDSTNGTSVSGIASDLATLNSKMVPATTSANGLMTSTDKANLNRMVGGGQASSNANNYTNTGFYWIGAAITNIPEGYGCLLVFRTGNFIQQLYLRPNKLYSRRNDGSSWGSWASVALA